MKPNMLCAAASRPCVAAASALIRRSFVEFINKNRFLW